jgi:thiamine-phosphate pyrophosphorylase
MIAMSEEAPRLFLITPRLADAGSFAPLLEAALDAGDVACLLIRADTRDEGVMKSIVRTLAPLAQERGTAVLVEHDARLAPRAGADGVHINGAGPELTEALAALKPDRIVGVGKLEGRDAAMEAGEAGADYLLFGGPDDDETHESTLERVEWWAGIFNVPCVGYARDPALAGEIAAAGAEFVALCDGLWDHPDTISTTIAAVGRAILPAPEAAR